MKSIYAVVLLVGLLVVGCEKANPLGPTMHVVQFTVAGTGTPNFSAHWQVLISGSPTTAYPQGVPVYSAAVPTSLPWTSGPVTCGDGAWGWDIGNSGSSAVTMTVVDDGKTLDNKVIGVGQDKAGDGSVQ